ncbi:MAG: hypothetical protein ACOY9B_09770 [Pseudomonadota bacterium]
MADWSSGSAELDEVAHACADQDWPRAQALLGAYCARAQDLAARGAVDDDTLRAMLEAQQRLAACLYAGRDEAARALARLRRNDRAIGAYRQDTE